MAKALQKKIKQLIRKSGVGVNQEFLVEAVYQNISRIVKSEADLPMVGELTAAFFEMVNNVVLKTVDATKGKKAEEEKIKAKIAEEKRKKEEERKRKEAEKKKEQQELQRKKQEEAKKREEEKKMEREESINEILNAINPKIEANSFSIEGKSIDDQKVDEAVELLLNLFDDLKECEKAHAEKIVPVKMNTTFAPNPDNKPAKDNEGSLFEPYIPPCAPYSLSSDMKAIDEDENKDFSSEEVFSEETINTSKFEKIYAFDTNIILNDASNIFNISQNGANLILLAETVLDELDSKKEGFDEINFQAREFARILSNAEIKEQIRFGDYYITRMVTNGISIDIIGTNNYQNIAETDRSIRNDRKILQVVKGARNDIYKRPITFLTLDAMCRIRALSMNITSELMLNKGNDYEGEFIKEIVLDKSFSIKSLKNGQSIFEINPEHKPENYCYRFIGTNGDKVLATIQDDKIIILDDSYLNRFIIKPRNEEQKFALSGMCDDFYKVVLIEALAGSGKTLLAITAGLRAITERKYEKLIYIRNSIESTDKGEEVGFLSGNEAKFEIYNHPLYDTLDFIARTSLKKANANKTPAARQVDNSRAAIEEAVKNVVQQLIKQYNIETIWNGAIRGRTLANAFVIVDECLHKEQQLVTNRGLLTVEEVENLIKNGEWVDVKSVNLATNTIEFKKLESLKKEHISLTNEKMYEITMEDGSILKLTGNHKLWCNNKYITVNEIIEIQKTGKEINLNVFK